MIGSIEKHGNVLVMSLLLSLAAASARAGHGDDYYWRCPYKPDGVCTPSRNTYGYYATKWSQWPGVTAADYESKLPSGAPAARAGAPSGTAPLETPDELLPPPGGVPGGDDAPPPLTPPTDARPDILTPPGEDIMDDFLSDDPAPQPDAAPNAEPDPSPKLTPETTPEPKPESDLPFDDDPFKDEPVFNEEDPPAPPSGTNRSGINPGAVSPTMPAMRSLPKRFPAAQHRHVPKSRLSRMTTPGEPRLMPAQSTGKSAASRPSRGRIAQARNPLRGNPTPEMVAVDEMVEPTQWQEPAIAEPEAESDWHANPLR